MKFSDLLKRQETERRAEERERDKFGASFCLERPQDGDWVKVKVIDNTEALWCIKVDVLEDSGGLTIPADRIARMKLDRAHFKHQEPHDRHFMTVVGVEFGLVARKGMRVPWCMWEVEYLTYGLETWDRGFRRV